MHFEVGEAGTVQAHRLAMSTGAHRLLAGEPEVGGEMYGVGTALGAQVSGAVGADAFDKRGVLLALILG